MPDIPHLDWLQTIVGVSWGGRWLTAYAYTTEFKSANIFLTADGRGGGIIQTGDFDSPHTYTQADLASGQFLQFAIPGSSQQGVRGIKMDGLTGNISGTIFMTGAGVSDGQMVIALHNQGAILGTRVTLLDGVIVNPFVAVDSRSYLFPASATVPFTVNMDTFRFVDP